MITILSQHQVNLKVLGKLDERIDVLDRIHSMMVERSNLLVDVDYAKRKVPPKVDFPVIFALPDGNARRFSWSSSAATSTASPTESEMWVPDM